ncbi:MAG TPA: hypothetical protein VGE01_10165 [Fimbriimonas sp.]
MYDHPTLLGRIVKWLLLPIAVALVGFYGFGPRFGGQVMDKIKESGVKLSVPKAKEGSSIPKPEVSVTSRRVGSRSAPTATVESSSRPSRVSSGSTDETPRRPRRRRRRRSTTSSTPESQQKTDVRERDERPKSSPRRSDPKRSQSTDAPPVIPPDRSDPPPIIDNAF